MRCSSYLLIKIHRKFTGDYRLCNKASLKNHQYSMLELMHHEQTNSSIALKVEIHPSYAANVSTENSNILRSWGWGLKS
jgi:hypothetical protein